MSARPVMRDLRRGAAAGTVATVAARLAGLMVVPIALHGLGPKLYGVWVVSSVIVTSQGLFDLGASQAAARYIAVGRSAGEGGNVRRVILLSVTVYATLSLIALAIIVPLSPQISILLGVPTGSRHGSEVLLCSGALAFGISNASGLMTSVLTGFNRAHAAYAAVAGGYVVYVATFVTGAATGNLLWAAAAAGPVLFAAQCALMIPPARTGLRELSSIGQAATVKLRELLSYSLSMQAASIADFMAPNLPRLLAAVMLGSAAVVPLDLTLRAASLMAGLIAMTQPAVLPALASAWGRADHDQYVRLARELFGVLCLAAAVLMLISVACMGAAIRLWVGSRYGDVEWLALAVTAALLIHGITGPLTAAAQARGDMRRLVSLKFAIIAILAVLLPSMSGLGVDGLGTALAIGMAGPSLLYCVAEFHGPLRASQPSAAGPAVIAPFIIATALSVGFRLIAHPFDAAVLLVSATFFGGALAWALYRLPPPIRNLLGRPMTSSGRSQALVP